ncbi:type II toxin-antitoxin system RelE/ParE family toxin [Marimonas sp. MJW-29]|uniref:Type II toxin-antitoxin system RelE/ParE family toxin n=1 Tax=Sulfitobacter sediminis TaxID=3234186 RepID=A0ABV3RS61_9RHOB
MSKTFELTPFAKSNLIDIVVWTIQNFGVAQAEKYEAMILARCAGLTDGTTPSRDCATLEGKPGPSGLLFARAERHFIIFEENDERIVVLAFLHVASDLVNRIGALKDKPFSLR